MKKNTQGAHSPRLSSTTSHGMILQVLETIGSHLVTHWYKSRSAKLRVSEQSCRTLQKPSTVRPEKKWMFGRRSLSVNECKRCDHSARIPRWTFIYIYIRMLVFWMVTWNLFVVLFLGWKNPPKQGQNSNKKTAGFPPFGVPGIFWRRTYTSPMIPMGVNHCHQEFQVPKMEGFLNLK